MARWGTLFRYARLKPVYVILRLEIAIPFFLHQDYVAFLTCFLLVMINVLAEADDVSLFRLWSRLTHHAIWSTCLSSSLAVVLLLRLSLANPYHLSAEVFIFDVCTFLRMAATVGCGIFACRAAAVLAEYAWSRKGAGDGKSPGWTGR